MVIPVRWKAPNTPSWYRSAAVYTTSRQSRQYVGTHYEGPTVISVIRQAVGNALVRRWRAELSGKYKV